MSLTGGHKMKRIDYEKEFKKRRNKKFQSLYSQIPFLATMPYHVRTWWIRYHKLKHTWKTNFNNLHFYPDDYPIGEIPPWEKPNYKNGYLGHNHQLNADLDDIECLFKRLGYDWIHVRLEDIEWPGVVECNYNDAEGCNGCRFRFRCEIRGD